MKAENGASEQTDPNMSCRISITKPELSLHLKHRHLTKQI